MAEGHLWQYPMRYEHGETTIEKPQGGVATIVEKVGIYSYSYRDESIYHCVIAIIAQVTN